MNTPCQPFDTWNLSQRGLALLKVDLPYAFSTRRLKEIYPLMEALCLSNHLWEDAPTNSTTTAKAGRIAKVFEQHFAGTKPLLTDVKWLSVVKSLSASKAPGAPAMLGMWVDNHPRACAILSQHLDLVARIFPVLVKVSSQSVNGILNGLTQEQCKRVVDCDLNYLYNENKNTIAILGNINPQKAQPLIEYMERLFATVAH